MGSLPKDFKSFASADFAILAYLCIVIHFLYNAKDFKSLASADFAILAYIFGSLRPLILLQRHGEIIAKRRKDVKWV